MIRLKYKQQVFIKFEKYSSTLKISVYIYTLTFGTIVDYFMYLSFAYLVSLLYFYFVFLCNKEESLISYTRNLTLLNFVI